jgi:ABC-2 type transport system permease protein
VHARVAQAFLWRDFRIATSYRAAFVIQIAGIFATVALFFFMGNMIEGAQVKALEPYGGSYFGFLLIGVALLDFLAVSLGSFGNSLREGQLTGTLEVVLLSPTSLIEVLLYSSLWFFAWTSLRFTLYLGVGALFDLPLGSANFGAAILVLALAILSFIPFGIFTASLIMLIKRGEGVNTLISGASLFFGGVLFPVASMPEWMQFLSHLLPFTYALEGMRQAIQSGKGIGELARYLVALAAFAVVLLPLSWLAFARAVRQARLTGTLGQY